MKLKINLMGLLFLLVSIGYTQDWKTYPYIPAGSLVYFPADEGRHVGEPIEWWYTSGHISTATNNYSFMFTFFHYPQDGFDGFRILNLTDEATGTFYQDVKPLHYTTLSTTDLDVEADVFLAGTEYWRNKVDGSLNPIPFEYELFASSPSVTLDLELETTKRPLILGDDGYLDQGSVNYTYYYSQTSNTVTGTLTLNGTTEAITGTAWIDRQYGDFNPLTGEKYEWFSLQLSNGMDLNLWNIFTSGRLIPDTPEYRILAAYVDETTQYTSSDFEIERLGFFCTDDEVNCYSKKWRLTSDTNNLDLVITALHTTTEVQLPFRFFEGSLSISGTVNGVSVTGVGFAELLHYYEDPQVTFASPSGGIYDIFTPISWNLSNPDDGRPVFYDLSYSIDNQNSFQSIATGLTESSYLWESPTVNDDDDIWFKIDAYSIDGILNSETISDMATVSTLSNPEYNLNGVKLYPNPTSTHLNLYFERPVSNLRLEIIDVNGRLLLQKEKLSTHAISINLNSISTGVYFVRVYSDTVEDFLKFIKD